MEFKADGDIGKSIAFLSQKIATGRFRRATNTDSKLVRHCANMMIISKRLQAI